MSEKDYDYLRPVSEKDYLSRFDTDTEFLLYQKLKTESEAKKKQSAEPDKQAVEGRARPVVDQKEEV